MSDQNTKINKKVEIDLAELLKKDAPYLVEDGKVNLEKLGGLLSGKITEKEDDRFYFNWAGKDKVFQAIQAPAYSTLAPQKDKSIGWDDTENLMIVGENLETLKLLLKPYFGKVKVIYIDPPYNTGRDFVYTDNFTHPLKDYMERTGQKDDNGTRLTSNTETNGRYHSDWLNFMYPRLFLARNLLTDDGLIFISIDDNEAHHLRMIMDEIFGEDNFISQIVWEKRYGRSNDAKLFAFNTEYILLYRKSSALSTLREPRSENQNAIYTNPDNDPRGVWTSVSFVSQRTKSERPNLSYEIEQPKLKETILHPTNAWKYSKEKYQELLNENRLYWGKDGTQKYPRIKRFLSELNEGMVPVSLWNHEETGTGEVGTREVEGLLKKDIFDHPKPVSLIKRVLNIATNNKEPHIVMDFFAGSGTTGHAVFELNKEDDGKRKFMLVQIDELTNEKSEAFKSGYKNISEISIDRLKRVSQKEDNELKFKVFQLSHSNFNLKEEFELTENKDLGELKSNYLKELGLYVDQPTVATANTLDIVYEIILKNGFSLNSKIEELKLGSNNFYKVNDAENELEIHISLDAKIEDGSVEAIRTTEYKGKTFAFYDNALTDSQKINLNTFVKLQVI